MRVGSANGAGTTMAAHGPDPGRRRRADAGRDARLQPAPRGPRGRGRARRRGRARAGAARRAGPGPARRDAAEAGRLRGLPGAAARLDGADPAADRQGQRDRQGRRAGDRRRRLHPQAVLDARAARPRQGAAAARRPRRGRRGRRDRGRAGAVGGRRDRDRPARPDGRAGRPAGAPEAEGVRPAGVPGPEPRPRLLARRAAREGLGVRVQRRLAHRRRARALAAREARGAAEPADADRDRARRRLPAGRMSRARPPVGRRLAGRITLAYVLLITALAVSLGVYLTLTLRAAQMNELQARLADEARLIPVAAAPPLQARDGERANNLARVLAPTIGARVTLIAADGVVLGDSEANPPE